MLWITYSKRQPQMGSMKANFKLARFYSGSLFFERHIFLPHSCMAIKKTQHHLTKDYYLIYTEDSNTCKVLHSLHLPETLKPERRRGETMN